MKTLNVTIRDKVATYQEEGGNIVCGNADYQIVFAFDDEWSKYATKFARIVASGRRIDIPIIGNSVVLPMLFNVSKIYVGAFVDGEISSTDAVIYCDPSILDYSANDVMLAFDTVEVEFVGEEGGTVIYTTLENGKIVPRYVDEQQIMSYPTIRVLANSAMAFSIPPYCTVEAQYEDGVDVGEIEYVYENTNYAEDLEDERYHEVMITVPKTNRKVVISWGV